MPAPARDRRLILAACTAESLALLGSLFFPALLPTFQAEWALTNTDAGWINGVFYGGYALAAPVLIGLTDRRDARQIYLASAALGAVAMFGFALLASGFWTAALFQIAAGVAFAGFYMPGLKALTDRLEGGEQSRAVAFYTGTTAIGMALSTWQAGFVADILGWRWAAAVAGAGAVLATAIFAACFRAKPPTPPPEGLHALLDFRPVLKNRLALGYVVGYAVHCWELFGSRAWMVAFLAFAFGLDPSRPALAATAQDVATVAIVVGIPASLLGNEGALRFGRRRMIAFYMAGTGLLGAGIGLAAPLPAAAVAALVVVYGGLTMVDSASLTAGMVAAADAGRQGMTMAVYSFVGFAMAFLGPLVFGVVLDLAGGGGGGAAAGWVWAWAVLGLVAASGPLWMRLLQGKWE